ncbi:MAG: hypothetical protein AAGJ93_06435, partial [Bacteroidota bacterium]
MKYFGLILLFLSVQLAFAQKNLEQTIPVVTATPRWLVGIESNIHFQDLDYYTSNFRYNGIGVQLEKPLGKFSIGTAIIQQGFSRQTFRVSSGLYQPPSDGSVELFGYEQEVNKLSFINIP